MTWQMAKSAESAVALLIMRRLAVNQRSGAAQQNFRRTIDEGFRARMATSWPGAASRRKSSTHKADYVLA
jgi:hypothetical protein